MASRAEINLLNAHIDILQADKSPRKLGLGIEGTDAHTCRAALSAFIMAAQLNALRPEPARPDSGFVSRLREQMLALCDDAPDNLYQTEK